MDSHTHSHTHTQSHTLTHIWNGRWIKAELLSHVWPHVTSTATCGCFYSPSVLSFLAESMAFFFLFHYILWLGLFIRMLSVHFEAEPSPFRPIRVGYGRRLRLTDGTIRLKVIQFGFIEISSGFTTIKVDFCHRNGSRSVSFSHWSRPSWPSLPIKLHFTVETLF